jgi:hypothetical protein
MKKCLWIILVTSLFIYSCEKIYFDDNENTPINNFDCFWNEIDRNFSFFSYLSLEWDSVRTVYRPRINQNTTNSELFKILGDMILLLKDGHSNLFTDLGNISYSDWYKKYPVNQVKNNQAYFETYSNYLSNIYYGKLKSANLGYIYIKSFTGDTSRYTVIDNILTTFGNTDGLIIDVRSNGGGNSINGTTISRRFADSTRYIFKVRYRNGPKHNDFNPWIKCYLFGPYGVRYKKPVVILTNRSCYSATGWFILEMSSLPQVKVIGDTTGGGSAQPILRELPNGWLVRVSNSQRIDRNGKDDQYTGCYPDIPVWINAVDLRNNKDRILERAVQELTKK